jgi:hypothetical protein
MWAPIDVPLALPPDPFPLHASIFIPIADENDVMREQLEYLIVHTFEQRGKSACAECKRYLRVRALLLEIFAEPSR